MRKIELDEMKKRLVNMLKELDDICNENGIELSLSGGTLLGAVRHNGFIPWDDDIDVYVPRPQYNKLIEIMRKRNPISRNKLFCHELDEKYLYAFAKYVDSETVLYESAADAGVQMGLYVDIFPIDGLGDSLQAAQKHMRKINKYICMNLALLVKPWRKNVSFVKNFAIACLRVISRIYGANRIHKKLMSIVNELPYETSKYVGEFIDEIGDKRIVLKSEMYEEYVLLPFEKLEFKAPKMWDKFLTQFYGNYMQLPPKDKQVLTHGYELYAKEGFEL